MENRIIEFKSVYEYYVKERLDVKNNTIRLFDPNIKDNRFELLEQFAKNEIFDLWIKVRRADNPKLFILRKIRDVSIYERTYYIITWWPANCKCKI